MKTLTILRQLNYSLTFTGQFALHFLPTMSNQFIMYTNAFGLFEIKASINSEGKFLAYYKPNRLCQKF